VPWVRVLSFLLYQLSPDGGNAVGGMGNDRWAGRLELKIWRKVWVFWCTHLDAGVQHVAPGSQLGELLKTAEGRRRWERYQAEMTKLEALVKQDVDDPKIHVTVLQGDMNMLPTKDGVHEHYSPHQLYTRLEMRYENERVGYIGVHGGKITKYMVYPAGHNGWGSDHAGLMAWVRPS
jgi:endonuclease/exonuclease/phosphatase family metal-dependent hydrolase